MQEQTHDFIPKNKPAIGDFKTPRKVKKREWIEDYFMQCALMPST